MDLRGVEHFLIGCLDVQCKSCLARDYHIASLKEEIHSRDALIESLRDQLAADRIDQQRIIEHITGMNRIAVNQEPGQLHSIHPRSGIQSRIRRAEQADAEEAEVLSAQRKREYNERVANLMKPETEVEGHAV